ncbi:threonine synthase [Clostridia bacterium]|nr:threonine synthase [Clostridia bacterium]
MFCPDSFPQISTEKLKELSAQPYYVRVAYVLSLYLDEFTPQELVEFCREAYSRFDEEGPAPVRDLTDRVAMLELWHGPTAAFKDMALQILPSLMTASLRKTGESRRVCILTATSGDTGKAALEGFRDREGCKVFVFYPADGVSRAQRLQMTTQLGGNVGVCGIRGNFDDAQSGVKAIFNDKALNDRLNAEGWMLSSANSINLGRLLPQVAYYVSAYCDMAAQEGGRLKWGAPLDVTVPTGNFGNILAAYYAKMMGLPLGRLICASNRNDVLAEFLSTGVYDRRRELKLTTSPSMDILVSSNFERALFHLSGGDADLVRDLMGKLTSDGVYVAPDMLRSAFDAHFLGGSCNDEDASTVIRETWNRQHILLDPHTAVAVAVAGANMASDGGSGNPMLVVSTASPHKFSEAVGEALGADISSTGVPIPRPLAGLSQKPVRFQNVIDINEMETEVLNFLNNK